MEYFPGKMGSQLQREMEFEYSIYPHEGDWKKANVYMEAQKLNVPLAPYQITQHDKGYLPQKHSFLSIQPENLILSAFKKAEDRETYILRLFNPTEEEFKGEIKLNVDIKEAYLTNLNEKRLSSLIVGNNGRINIDVGANKIITLEIDVLKEY